MTAALVAAVLVCVAVTLPPRRLTLPPPNDGTVSGILHVHTNRSDGLSSPDDVAAAAARAGLKFVVFTDHGDGTRPPDRPTYRSGVLCLDGVEISTTGGHYIAIDMPASPYPLGGEPRDVAEDVKRLGGFGIAAHPDSPKAQLQWRDWRVPFDGLELLNPDTSWRILSAEPGWASKRRLAFAFLDYAFRPTEVMTSLIQPSAAIGRWIDAAVRRRVVAIAGADAHAKLAPRNADPGDSRYALPLPSYQASFGVLSVHARLDRRLNGDAASDAAALMRAIRNGRLYTAVNGLASPPSFEFTATNSFGTVSQGSELALGGPIALHVSSNAPPSFTTIVHDGTKTLAAVKDAPDLTVHGPATAGVFWAEIVAADRTPPITWVRSNAVYVRDAIDAAPTPEPLLFESRSLIDRTAPDGGARLETPLSEADVRFAQVGGEPRLTFTVRLGQGTPSNQAAALVFDTPSGIGGLNRVRLEARAQHRMRVSIQLRSGAGSTPGDRWIRSIYLDEAWRTYTIPFTDMTPAGDTRAATPTLDSIRSVMLVVDLTNTKPGFAGTVTLRAADLQR